jgi:lipoic acid synthetase
MILGDVCTRRCGFCAVAKGLPGPPDEAEPERLAAAAADLGLDHVVVTSVTRDDLADGGASQFAGVVVALRERTRASVEILTPDFAGRAESLGTILGAPPDVFNHNVETVPRLYPRVRPGADYRRSLRLLSMAAAAGLTVKSGIMAGLGEEDGEIGEVLGDLREAGCTLVTIGQYLRPTRGSLPVERYPEPEWFAKWAEVGYTLGFKHVASAPLARSSYRAGEGYRSTV